MASTERLMFRMLALADRDHFDRVRGNDADYQHSLASGEAIAAGDRLILDGTALERQRHLARPGLLGGDGERNGACLRDRAADPTLDSWFGLRITRPFPHAAELTPPLTDEQRPADQGANQIDCIHQLTSMLVNTVGHSKCATADDLLKRDSGQRLSAPF